MTETENVGTATLGEIGAVLGNQLATWRPEANAEDVTQAIMVALERYSIQTEGSGEGGLRTIIFRLREGLDARLKSF